MTFLREYFANKTRESVRDYFHMYTIYYVQLVHKLIKWVLIASKLSVSKHKLFHNQKTFTVNENWEQWTSSILQLQRLQKQLRTTIIYQNNVPIFVIK